MNRKIMACAVLGALASPVWAGGSRVQLYGAIDLGVTHFTGVDNGAGGATSWSGLGSGVESASRLGVKGTEALGQGLSADFAVETGFCAAGLGQDGSAGTAGALGPSGGYCTGGGFMQRESWADLRGRYGTLRVGRDYTLLFRGELAADPFGYGLNGTVSNLSLSGKQSGFAFVRSSELAEYLSPREHGVTMSATYSFAPLGYGTVPTAAGLGSRVPRAWGLAAHMVRGALQAGLDYTQINDESLGLDAAGNDTGSLRTWQIYGSYDFALAKLAALYERCTADFARGSRGLTGGGNRYWMLGGTLPLGQGDLMASFSEATVGQDSVLMASSVHGTARQLAVGYRYRLSKSTDLYSSYSHIDNSAHTNFAVGSSTDVLTGVAGQSSSGMAFGMRHWF